MRKGFGFILVVAVGILAAQEAHRVPDALGRVELFRVNQVFVEGARHFTPEEIRGTAAIPAGANLWESLDPITRRLNAHEGIREARVSRRFPGTLVIEIVEREPVALLPNPLLTPVDMEGRFLPIDPAVHRMDLPLLQPLREPASDGTRLTPGQVRRLATELKLLGELDPNVLSSVSEAALDGWGDVLLHLGEPRLTLHYRTPLTPRRLQEGLVVLADVLERSRDRRPVRIDLRFADQVVVHFDPSDGR